MELLDDAVVCFVNALQARVCHLQAGVFLLVGVVLDLSDRMHDPDHTPQPEHDQQAAEVDRGVMDDCGGDLQRERHADDDEVNDVQRGPHPAADAVDVSLQRCLVSEAAAGRTHPASNTGIVGAAADLVLVRTWAHSGMAVKP